MIKDVTGLHGSDLLEIAVWANLTITDYFSKLPNVKRGTCAVRLWLALASNSSLVPRATVSGALDD